MLTYVLNQLPHTFPTNTTKNQKSINVLVAQRDFYFLALHFKLSTVWYSTQLIDIFAYGLPTQRLSRSGESGKYKQTADSVVVYNFHNLFNQERVFVFTSDTSGGSSSEPGLKSVTNLFANAAWLEREVAEMSGIAFDGKSDLRNLMLPYGDVTSPLKKSFPSAGFKEIFYDINNDMLIQAPNSLQI